MASPTPYPPELVRLARDTARRGTLERGPDEGAGATGTEPDSGAPRAVTVGALEVRSGVARNPRCGDALSLQVGLEGGFVRVARHDGEACALGLAGAAAVTEALEGAAVSDARAILAALTAAVTAGEVPEVPVFAPFLAVHPLPARHRCATLAVEAAARALGCEGPSGLPGPGPAAPSGLAAPQSTPDPVRPDEPGAEPDDGLDRGAS
jgi:NifU-like protein involved in Fe-S cluster formation